MKKGKKTMNMLIGILLIIVGAILMMDFLLKFLKFALGIVVLLIGIQFVMNRR